MILTETGVLPIGIEVDGVRHREFELREQLIRDTVELYDNQALSARIESNAAFAGLALLCRRMLRLGTLAPAAITPELLLDLHDDDYQAISEAATALIDRRQAFRAQPEEQAPALVGAPEAGF